MKRSTIALLGIFLIAIVQLAGAEPDPQDLLRRAEDAFAKGDYYVAERAYQRLLFHDSGNPDLMFHLAQCYQFSERPEAAEKVLLRMAARGHDRVDMALLLGDIHMHKGHWAAARAQFEKAIRLDPSNAGAYLRLGDALSRLSDPEGADAAFETYLRLTGK